METGGEVLGEGAEFGVDGDGSAALGFAVEEEGFGNGDGEHFFEAEGLGAELDFVGAVAFRFAALVFDGDDAPVAVEFDDVGLAVESETVAGEVEAAGGSQAGAGFGGAVVGALVEDAAGGGEVVLGPEPLDVDEGALALAVEEVLEGGNGEGGGGGGDGF